MLAYISAISSMALIWFLAVTIPGPNFIIVTQVSMGQSRKMGFFIALGVSAGAGVWATASLLGLSMLFRYATWLYSAVKFIGGCYLIYMGLTIILNTLKTKNSSSNSHNLGLNCATAFRKGMLTSFSNPKTAAFFGSLFLSTFPAQAPLWFYIVAVLTVMVISILWYWLVAYFFSFDKVRNFYQRAKRILDIATGSLFSYLGGRLIFART
jgi:RhtB (resistance to homoserine/threonine) family protein